MRFYIELELKEEIESAAAVIDFIKNATKPKTDPEPEKPMAGQIGIVTAEAMKNGTLPTTEAPKPQTKVTVEDIRSKLAVLNKNGKQKEVKELINSFNASKLTEVDPADYAEMLEKAGEI